MAEFKVGDEAVIGPEFSHFQKSHVGQIVMIKAAWPDGATYTVEFSDGFTWAVGAHDLLRRS